MRLPVLRSNVILVCSRANCYTCFVLWAALIGVIGGCGYSSKLPLQSQVRSIYIPIFDNDTFRRGLEFDLTKAVRDQILLKTRLAIVDRERADSILLGKITHVQENVLIKDARDNIVESRVYVGINVRWVDKRTGRTIIERHLQEPAEFVIQREETLTSSNNEAFVRLATGIIEAMEGDW